LHLSSSISMIFRVAIISSCVKLALVSIWGRLYGFPANCALT
jgi:hypothetical protein